MKVKKLRWWIIGLIALATAINYLDRQNLPVAISEIRKSFSVSEIQYGIINSLFLFAYGTMYAVGGRITDILGTRISYAVMIIWWSLANLIHGIVSGITGLGVARFLLGMGEGGAFPASAKAISEWFPVKERSFAFGIFNTGSSLGAVVAPPLIAFIITVFDWRWAFFLTGLLGLIWAVVWYRIYSTPGKSIYITNQELQYISESAGRDDGLNDSSKQRTSVRDLLKIRKVWGLLSIKFFTDAGWFFFIFWLPKYLYDIRGLNITGIGTYAWVPYAFAGCGSFFGGWLSSYLLRRNFSLDLARKIPLGMAAILLPASLFITSASLNMAIVFFSMAMFGHQFWSTIVQTLAADMFPSRIVGSVSGLMGFAGTYGAMLFSLILGFLIDKFGYNPAFIISGILHPLSFILIFVLIRKIQVVDLQTALKFNNL